MDSEILKYISYGDYFFCAILISVADQKPKFRSAFLPWKITYQIFWLRRKMAKKDLYKNLKFLR